MKEVSPKRPMLRYHGGKWKLAPWIISHFPRHRVYVEPFGGGASILLKKPRSYAEIYNDLDGEVVNVFRVARDHGAALNEALTLTPFAREEFKASYAPSEDPVEAARRTIVRSFMGFGSNAITASSTGFRANSNRSGTTPAHDWRNYADCFWMLVDRVRGVTIEQKDAMEVMEQHDGPQALHYVDPPYVHSTRSKRNEYCAKHLYRHELTDEQHRALAAFLGTLKGTVIVSGYPSPLYDEIFQGWRCIETAALADGALERTECLWLSPNHHLGPRGPLFEKEMAS